MTFTGEFVNPANHYLDEAGAGMWRSATDDADVRLLSQAH